MSITNEAFLPEHTRVPLFEDVTGHLQSCKEGTVSPSADIAGCRNWSSPKSLSPGNGDHVSPAGFEVESLNCAGADHRVLIPCAAILKMDVEPISQAQPFLFSSEIGLLSGSAPL